ncbi:helix-turn-helix domain-containing protein [Kocuria arenosa]|uniref:helix-turn-helix domain-containing protein n=1 Tax=Kocuria arenosa TaxID=3071446 RepID=UPI0034D69F9B
MNDVHPAAAHASWASSVADPLSRAAAFAALRPALEALIHQAGADSRLSLEARRVLRAVARTRPEHTLASADLAARASTAKARVRVALAELEAHGYLAQLARIAPHFSAALPPHTRCTPAAAPTVEPVEADTA